MCKVYVLVISMPCSMIKADQYCQEGRTVINVQVREVGSAGAVMEVGGEQGLSSVGLALVEVLSGNRGLLRISWFRHPNSSIILLCRYMLWTKPKICIMENSCKWV